MKSLILAALGLGLVTLPALAQDNTPAPALDAPAAAAPGDAAAPPPPPPPPGDMAGPRDDGPGGPGPKGPGMDGPRGDHRGPPPPPKGASFKLESGDNKIDVKCADDEPMQACADIVFRILDRFSPPVPGVTPGAPAAPAPAQP